MTTYGTSADLLTYVDSDTLIALTDDDQDGAVDAAVIADLLLKSSSEIDAALLAAGYEVPASSPGSFLSALAAKLALAPLYSRRPNTGLPEGIKAIWDDATRMLRDIASGKLSVSEATLSGGATYAGGVAVDSYDDRGWEDAEI